MVSRLSDFSCFGPCLLLQPHLLKELQRALIFGISIMLLDSWLDQESFELFYPCLCVGFIYVSAGIPFDLLLVNRDGGASLEEIENISE
ncbi:hypothetical protein K7X08_023101 [Anisodus acutangulus]|uniref:Uncharacterized protein n=1 Tax=Anisodus acutangulus TaxID=402998 RepID=A0A9Q1MGZ4_9SOLA|nr:hypothetical protein K7X08_023101 [Anisodus acutangulus]